MTLLGPEEFEQQLRGFEHSAFRLELQAGYREPVEEPLLASFLAGEHVDPEPVYRGWYELIAEHVRHGRTVERVRVHQDPPTDYQRFERYLDAWNIEAGEVMRYLTWERAHEVGLLPAAGDEDWWLLDESRLIVMRFDDQGNRVENELVTDPESVRQACAWRDLAVHHSALQGAPV